MMENKNISKIDKAAGIFYIIIAGIYLLTAAHFYYAVQSSGENDAMGIVSLMKFLLGIGILASLLNIYIGYQIILGKKAAKISGLIFAIFGFILVPGHFSFYNLFVISPLIFKQNMGLNTNTNAEVDLGSYFGGPRTILFFNIPTLLMIVLLVLIIISISKHNQQNTVIFPNNPGNSVK